MVVEVGRLHELDVAVPGRDPLGVFVDALHQDAGEEEIGKHHDAPVAQLGGVFQAGFDQGKGDAGIAGLAPAETEAFPQ